MSILSRNKKTDAPEQKVHPAISKQVSSEKRGGENFKKGKLSKDKVGLIIVEPIVSEKSSLGAALGKYVFKVANSANKSEVKKAVESFYSVNVTDVNISKTAAKPRRRGRVIGKKAGFKKAIITLKEGESIDFGK